MRSSRFSPHLWLLLLLIASPAKAERLFTATCEKLTGTKLALVNGRATSSLESHLAPVFYVNSESPKTLFNEWTINGSTEKYESIIVLSNAEMIQAIELTSNGLLTYTISLTEGMLLYSHHRTVSPFDPGVNLLSFAAKCDIKTKR